MKVLTDKEFAKKLVAFLEKAIPTMSVKTASASRAGHAIQVRITYLENKKRLGYYSEQLHKGRIPFSAITPTTLIKQVFRLHNRIGNWMKSTSSRGLEASRSQKIMKDVISNLNSGIVLAYVDSLCPIIYSMMGQVIRDGECVKARLNRNQKRAKKSLASTLDYAFSSGVSDDEVRDMLREMLREAIVRHTMES